jgi:hypothetical protein
MGVGLRKEIAHRDGRSWRIDAGAETFDFDQREFAVRFSARMQDLIFDPVPPIVPVGTALRHMPPAISSPPVCPTSPLPCAYHLTERSSWLPHGCATARCSTRCATLAVPLPGSDQPGCRCRRHGPRSFWKLPATGATRKFFGIAPERDRLVKDYCAKLSGFLKECGRSDTPRKQNSTRPVADM